MLAFYLFALVLGGIFVGLSVFAGLGEGDVDVDADADVDVDVDADVDADVDGHVGAGDKEFETGLGHKRYRPWLSFKFYTFALAFMGLMGTVLTLFDLWENALGVLGVSIAVGLVSGLGVSYVLHMANRTEGGRAVGDDDFIGAQGRVLLPLQQGQRGTIRVRYQGRTIDLLAEVDDEAVVLGLNDECYVMSVEDGVAKVVDAAAVERWRKD
jgi:membrane protein implicated in regulation of membrane protease activity